MKIKVIFLNNTKTTHIRQLAVLAFMFAQLLSACGKPNNHTLEQMLVNHLRFESFQLQDVQILFTRSINQGTLLVYNFRATEGSSIHTGTGYIVAKQTLLSPGWIVEESGTGIIYQPPPLIAYSSGPMNAPGNTLVFGRSFSPNVKAVEVVFDTGTIMRDVIVNQGFAIVVPERTNVQELRVLGPNDEVLKRYYDPNLWN